MRRHFFIAVANDEATEKFNLENNSMHPAAGGCGVGAAGGSAPRRKPGTELQLKAQMRWLVGNGHPGKLKELEERVNSKEMKVAFSLYPVSIQQLFDIADSGNVMPPKSTWFEPKLRDGLFTHLIA